MQGSTRIDELRQKFHENPRRYFAPLANEYRKAGDPEQAIAICRAHLAQQPGHMSGHVVYAQALYDAKRTEEARAIFEKALSLDPDNAIVLRHLGDIAREKGENAEARHWYTRALDADPQDKEIAAYIAELTEPLTEAAASPAEPPKPSEENVEEPVESPAGAPVESPAEEGAEESVETVTPSGPSTEETVPEEDRSEVEIPLPEPSREPEVGVESAEETHEPRVAEVSPWLKTPPHEESPFVTRTMAELYAKQGYHQAALDVYRQLALQHPDDKEIFDRIEELELKERPAPIETLELAEPPESAQPAASEPETPKAEVSAFPEINPVITDAPSEGPSDSFAHLTEESLYAPDAEDLNLPVSDEEEQSTGVHFTEMELATQGDSWDADSWGAGFSADEEVADGFATPDVKSKSGETASEEPAAETAPPEPAPVAEPVAPAPPLAAEAEALDVAWGETSPAEAAPEVTSGASEAATPEPTLAAFEPFEPVEAGSLPEPAMVPELEAAQQIESAPEPAHAEIAPPEPTESVLPRPEPAEMEAAPAGAAEEPHFVAYSPQLPEEKDLPHFAPKGPTVREFFATLGAYRPPSAEGTSITAHAAASRMAPQTETEPQADYPLASDAFANLFAGSEVSEEDSRAAFALSGALAATTPASEPVVPAAPQAEPAPVASPAPAQESEEDIRKFREWLDGLTES